jgi:hypothetical protein
VLGRALVVDIIIIIVTVDIIIVVVDQTTWHAGCIGNGGCAPEKERK